MDDDIDFINRVVDYDFSDLSKYSITVKEGNLIDTQFSKANPISRAFLLLSAQYSPLDLANGKLIDTGNSLASFNRKQYHHVFPNSFLNKNGEPKIKRFSLMNFCFLPADSNKKISSKSPSDYFKNIIPGANKLDILNSNLLPNDFLIYENDDFDSFLQKRAELVLERLQDHTNG